MTLVILGLLLALLVYSGEGLPPRGDPEAPASLHVSPSYIEQSVRQTKTPNVVTAVLADYRGYDTLGETVVILAAALAVILILPRGRIP